jgi:hypothetical protein
VLPMYTLEVAVQVILYTHHRFAAVQSDLPLSMVVFLKGALAFLEIGRKMLGMGRRESICVVQCRAKVQMETANF